MKSQQRGTTPSQIGPDYAAFTTGLEPTREWVPDGPTVRFRGLLKITRMGRTKAYEVMKSDPDFPKGTPLFDTYRSPRFWWIDQVLAWMRGREAKFQRRQEARA